VRRIVHPHLRARHVDGKLAGEARGVRVEDARPDAPVGEEVYEEMGLGKVGRGVDALQKRIDTMPVTPSSSMPERPDTFVYASDTPTLLPNCPRTPRVAVVKLVSDT
jgi:hypothetical protein